MAKSKDKAAKTKQVFDSCSVCEVERDEEMNKYWRGKYCNPCYMKIQNRRRAKKRKPVNRDQGSQIITTEAERAEAPKTRYGTWLYADEAALFFALEAITNKSRVDLFRNWIVESAREVIESKPELNLDLDSMIQTGRILMNAKDKTCYL